MPLSISACRAGRMRSRRFADMPTCSAPVCASGICASARAMCVAKTGAEMTNAPINTARSIDRVIIVDVMGRPPVADFCDAYFLFVVGGRMRLLDLAAKATALHDGEG